MKEEYIHEFKGFGRVPSKCKVIIYYEDNINYICFEDLGIGTSVTNASEQIASEIVEKMDLTPSFCRFFETYGQYDNDTFDEISYKWQIEDSKWKASEPDWTFAPDEIKDMFLTL